MIQLSREKSIGILFKIEKALMKKRKKISQTEVEPLLAYIKNIELKLQEASGLTVAIELRMRLIGQFSQLVQDKVKELVKKWNTKNPKAKKSDKYWNCDLSFLDQSIIDIFQNVFSPIEHKNFLEFRNLRNSLLHADFVALMTALKISPTGRQILSANNNILSSEDIEEAIKSVDRNQGLTMICIRANEIIVILDNILRKISSEA